MLSLQKSSQNFLTKRLTSGSTSASIRRKCEAEDSSPPRQQIYEWADKDLHWNMSAGSSAGGQPWTEDFYLTHTLKREGSVAMTFSFFPLQTNWKKCRALCGSLPACFHYHSSTTQRAEWQNSHAQLWRWLSAVKGISGLSESTFAHSRWPQRTGLLLQQQAKQYNCSHFYGLMQRMPSSLPASTDHSFTGWLFNPE